jgi:hypothetical protein
LKSNRNFKDKELITLKKFGRKTDYRTEPDYIIGVDCCSCGSHSEGYEAVEDQTCEVCGCTDVTVETSHEGMTCSCCGDVFDCWEDGYRNEKTGQLICQTCFSKLD